MLFSIHTSKLHEWSSRHFALARFDRKKWRCFRAIHSQCWWFQQFRRGTVMARGTFDQCKFHANPFMCSKWTLIPDQAELPTRKHNGLWQLFLGTNIAGYHGITAPNHKYIVLLTWPLPVSCWWYNRCRSLCLLTATVSHGLRLSFKHVSPTAIHYTVICLPANSTQECICILVYRPKSGHIWRPIISVYCW